MALGRRPWLTNSLTPLKRTGRQVIRASGDGFHWPRADRYRCGRDCAEGYFLDSFDYRALRSERLDPLGPGGDRRFRTATFDYRHDRPVSLAHEIADNDAIPVFDGVFLQPGELADCWELRVWVEAPFTVTLPRAMRRDAARDDLIAIEATYTRRYVPGQMLYLTQFNPKSAADVIVDNADLAGPVLRFRRAF